MSHELFVLQTYRISVRKSVFLYQGKCTHFWGINSVTVLTSDITKFDMKFDMPIGQFWIISAKVCHMKVPPYPSTVAY